MAGSAPEQLKIFEFRSLPETTVRGLDVPIDPILEPGRYVSWETWIYKILHPSAFHSAKTEGALDGKPLGPRGGLHYAIVSVAKWKAWARLYRERVTQRMAGEAARRMGYAPKRKRR